MDDPEGLSEWQAINVAINALHNLTREEANPKPGLVLQSRKDAIQVLIRLQRKVQK
jgi:hypothetical protein